MKTDSQDTDLLKTEPTIQFCPMNSIGSWDTVLVSLVMRMKFKIYLSGF